MDFEPWQRAKIKTYYIINHYKKNTLSAEITNTVFFPVPCVYLNLYNPFLLPDVEQKYINLRDGLLFITIFMEGEFK